ncbi:MAG: DCC1-like thiol-disulfide oxidoreductase family protein [Beijerinckiaceae bacterium]|nr:DCC1-like thiol-disulfide oxidoreductase family protein [Beijerinckiaceae bacterium]
MTSRPLQAPSLTVFYNTRCPVCDYGVSRQASLLRPAVESGEVAFRDINLEPQALCAFGVTLEDIRKRLHAIDGKGDLLVGADVAIALWRLTPGQAWLAAWFGNRLFLPVTRLTYDGFARVLYSWNRRKGHW